MPALLAGLGFERNQIIVGRLHEEVVVPHPDAAIADVGAALGFPEVVPQLAAVARIHGPGVVRHREVENSVHLEYGGFDRAAARGKIARPFSADNDGCAGRRLRVHPGRQPPPPAPAVKRRRPGKRQILDGRLIDFLERAVSPSGIIAVVSRPRFF